MVKRGRRPRRKEGSEKKKRKTAHRLRKNELLEKKEREKKRSTKLKKSDMLEKKERERKGRRKRKKKRRKKSP